jgi:hypothetical protein
VARIVIAALVGVAAGTALGAWIFRGTRSTDSGSATVVAAELKEQNERLARSVERRIDDLAARVERIASSPAVPLRQNVPTTPESARPTDAHPETEDLAAALGRLEQRIETMSSALAAQKRIAVYPSAEQLRAHRTSIDWGEIARLSAAFVGDRETGLAMVRYLTFDEILERFGPPSTINPAGNWFYERREGETLGPETLELDFVNGYVVYVHSTDE